MLYLDNRSPIPAEILLLNDAYGASYVSVVAQARFYVKNGQWSLANEQDTPQLEDQYLAEPGKSSILLPSNATLGKPSSDIIIHGDAISPSDEVSEMSVSAQIGQLSAGLKVFGNRYWNGQTISRASSFSRIPIIYENAFGGGYTDRNGNIIVDQRNPVGKGLYNGSAFQDKDRLPLPNIEDPLNLINRPNDKPIPAGFGAIAPSWTPRLDYAGSYDDEWQKNRAPLLPKNFDARFYNVANPKLIYPSFLQGDENIIVKGMSEGNSFECQLPSIKLNGEAWVVKGKVSMPFLVETLLIRPNENYVTMIWRSSLKNPNPKVNVSKIILSLSR